MTMAWNTVCSSFEDGGLSLRSIRSINEAAMLKLSWNLISSSDQWAKFLKSRFFRNAKPVEYHIISFLWPALRHWCFRVPDNVSWQIGNGDTINFWSDKWPEEPIVDTLHLPNHLHMSLKATISDFVVNNQWNLPSIMYQNCLALVERIHQVHVPIEPCDDIVVRSNSDLGSSTFKEAYLFLFPNRKSATWCKKLWIPLTKSFVVWRLYHHKMPTDQLLKKEVAPQSPCVVSVDNQRNFQNIYSFIANLLRVYGFG